MAKALDMTGQRYGRLVVTGPHERRNGRIHWPCRCDCGNTKVIFAGSLRAGLTASCGCLKSEVTAARNRTHGSNERGKRMPEYTIWNLMRQRCENPKVLCYPRYGGRGIKVCDRWSDFAVFLTDVGRRPTPQHTLERIDNAGPYAPENCRWASRREQANNTRRNRWITYNGETRTVAMWARHTGIRVATLRQRLDKLGWSIERALTTPNRT